MALSWSMDKIGPICRSAEDCAIVFDIIRGSDGLDLTSTMQLLIIMQKQILNHSGLDTLKVHLMKKGQDRHRPEMC